MNVRLYFNTGYDTGNVPDTPAKLDNELWRDCPAIDLLQNKYLAEITVKSTYKGSYLDGRLDLDSADYLRLTTDEGRAVYYAIDSVEMLSHDTAKFKVTEDFITTAGGLENIKILSGIITRRSKSSNDYKESSFLDDELLGCAKPLELEFEVASKGNTNNFFEGTESTIDLSHGINYQSITDATSGISQLIPTMLRADKATVYKMGASDGTYQELPNRTGAKLYTQRSNVPGSPDNIEENVAKARSLGVENAILSQYKIPYDFVSYDSNSNTLNGIGAVVDTDLDIIPSDIDVTHAYRCVFSGDRSKFGLIGASGDKIEFNAEEIAFKEQGSGSPTLFQNDVKIRRAVDPRPEGRPYYRFENIHAGRMSRYGGISWANSDLMFSVKGAKWNNSPLKFTEISGGNILEQQFYNSRRVTDRQYAGTIAQLKNASSMARLNEAYNFLVGGEKAIIGTGLGALGVAGGAGLGSFLSQAGITANDLLTSRIRNASITNAAEIAQATTEGVYEFNKIKEYYDYGVRTQTIAPEVWFTDDMDTLRDISGNGCVVYRYKPSLEDVARLTVIIKMFGEKTFVPIENNTLVSLLRILAQNPCGHYFSYIQIEGAQISEAGGGSGTTKLSKAEREGMSAQFSAGVRFWRNTTPKNYQVGYTDYLNLSA